MPKVSRLQPVIRSGYLAIPGGEFSFTGHEFVS
jgi:hypothetical protein